MRCRRGSCCRQDLFVELCAPEELFFLLDQEHPLTPLSPGFAGGEGAEAASPIIRKILSFAWSAFSLPILQLRSSCAPSAGQDGPLLYPGPLCGGEGWTTGPQGDRQGCRSFFARTGDGMDAGVRTTQEQLSESGRKTRPVLTNLPGMVRAWMPEVEQRRSSCRMPGKRQAGWPLFWLIFSGHAEKSDSPSAGGRKLFASNRTEPRHRD